MPLALSVVTVALGVLMYSGLASGEGGAGCARALGYDWIAAWDDILTVAGEHRVVADAGDPVGYLRHYIMFTIGFTTLAVGGTMVFATR